MFGTYIGNQTMLIKTSYGGMLTISSLDRSMMPLLVASGSHEIPLTKYLSNNLKNGEVFVDIGTNVGYFTILAAKLVGETGHVIGYEANPSTIKYANDNILMNWVDGHVTLKQKAIYSMSTTLPFYRSYLLEGESSIKALSKLKSNDDFDVVQVEAVTIDEELGDISTVDWLKIDIEGGEFHAFQGMLNTIRNRKIKNIIFEWNKTALGADAAPFLELLRSIQANDKCLYYTLNIEGQALLFDIDFLEKIPFHPFVIMTF